MLTPICYIYLRKCETLVFIIPSCLAFFFIEMDIYRTRGNPNKYNCLQEVSNARSVC